jgi:RNA ligase (TIGR02306 family)
MAYFAVSIEEIGTINPIEGADRIQVATVKGLNFNFVIGKDVFKLNDKVLYIPIDSVIPQALAEKLGVAGKLAGKNKDYIKSVKLKGIISQGIVGHLSLIDGLVDRSPENITQFLGVTKYEPPEVICHGGKLIRHAENIETYDLEGADRYYKVADQMMDMPVYISSKIEGSNFYGGVNLLGEFVVGQRSGMIIPDDGGNLTHTWWVTAKSQGLLDAAATIRNDLFAGSSVILRGEIIGPGIQGNYYNVPKYKVLIFDIKVDDKYLSSGDFINICNKYNIETVPVLSVGKTLKEWLNGRTVKEASNHRSMLIDKHEEGIVIKPMVEQHSEVLSGRMCIKQRSAVYLCKVQNEM